MTEDWTVTLESCNAKSKVPLVRTAGRLNLTHTTYPPSRRREFAVEETTRGKAGQGKGQEDADDASGRAVSDHPIQSQLPLTGRLSSKPTALPTLQPVKKWQRHSKWTVSVVAGVRQPIGHCGFETAELPSAVLAPEVLNDSFSELSTVGI
ncbi:hypothetical protein B0T21DRAFT_348916 [Apiosordaria backusii]|uniref:Uncharacterized protein n=1 Tax=Apiosordaria backusii TaxID=314023 RepID=A0AA40EFA1_9PEZI|nr:hypothetical protein B0T21DRAFT_348916 [Apiosordaria backusii]